MDGSLAEAYHSLSNLLRDQDASTAEARRFPAATSGRKVTPASFGRPPTQAEIAALPKAKPFKDKSKEIWADNEVDDPVDGDDADDGRARPKYEFLYKQAVGTEDTYLGMGDKDPSSTSCEAIVVRVSLPGTKKASELNLDVQPTYLRLTSADYKLAVYLPHRVAHDKGNAQWDAKAETLSVSLPIIRDDLIDRVAPLE